MNKPTKGIAVDCGCRGNPSMLAEYRGILLRTNEVIFEFKIKSLCTNNIAEFAALVHGVKYLIENKIEGKVYSDSRTAISWYRRGSYKTTLPENEQTNFTYILLKRAVDIIPKKDKMSFVEFWSNELYGETPADYGRKN